MNRLLKLAVPFIQYGKPLDVEKLAAEADIDIDTAKQVLDKAMDHLQNMLNRKRK